MSLIFALITIFIVGGTTLGVLVYAAYGKNFDWSRVPLTPAHRKAKIQQKELAAAQERKAIEAQVKRILNTDYSQFGSGSNSDEWIKQFSEIERKRK